MDWKEANRYYQSTGWMIFPNGSGQVVMRHHRTGETRLVDEGADFTPQVGSEVAVVLGPHRGSRGVVLDTNGMYARVKVKSGGMVVYVRRANLLVLPPEINHETGVDVTPSGGLTTQTLPKTLGVAEGERRLLGHSSEGVWLDEVCPDDMEEPSYEAPCRCPSLLAGHGVACQHHPDYDRVLTEEERERKRLENVWAIPKPREPLSYKTPSDSAASREEKIFNLGMYYGIKEDMLPRWFKEAMK